MENLTRIRIMIIDDHPVVRAGLASMLSTQPLIEVVASAASGLEALAILERERFDVMLVDIAMPEHDGYELIRTVRALPSPETAHVPAAALTAFARDEDQKKSYESGFQLHLTKPIDPALLVEAVATLRAQNAAAV